MPTATSSPVAIRVEPLTPDNWPDLETLFGPKGACDGCWCMFYRQRYSVYSKQTSGQHHDGLKAIVDSGHVPGLIAYVDDQPAGWCAVGPREDFDHLEHSNALKRLDDLPVWSMPCFYIDKNHRGKGIMHALLQAAISYAASQGATLIESYPAPGDKKISSAEAYKGLASLFSKAGFVEIKRVSTARVIMRCSVDGSDTGIDPQT